MIPRIFFPLLLAGLICCRPMAAENPLLVLDCPMSPPAWALMERELLRLNSEACEIFAAKYVDGPCTLAFATSIRSAADQACPWTWRPWSKS